MFRFEDNKHCVVCSYHQGTLRVLLVLLHDFPEFLCDYFYSFCDVIPLNCVQMRNLILSTFPRNMRLPDPFTPNLKVDVLPEISHTPRIMTNFANLIQPASFKKVCLWDNAVEARTTINLYWIPRDTVGLMYIHSASLYHWHSNEQACPIDRTLGQYNLALIKIPRTSVTIVEVF